MILSIKSDEATDSELNHIDQFCKTYWSPVASFVCSLGISREDAEDLTQEIFATLHQGNKISELSPTKGRMRSYLKVTAKHKAYSFRRNQNRQKRGGTSQHIPLEEDQLESAQSGPEKDFDRKWALRLLDLTADELRNEYQQRGRSPWFDHLFPNLTNDGSHVSYRNLASKLEASESAVRTALHRMRQKYQKMLRSQVSKTVASEDEIDTEIHSLFDALA